ncbi:NAD(P)H-dependent flavin oxidoreductase [Falsibacillus pallidus]|uniref:NAD(P)H-dependent flavin oxidoreductase n=1 Tax=Falsibacillus pallidus TaxID=493781 RepID=UPI003D98BA61
MNQLTKILKIRYPVIQGGMGNISNAQLTAAVSNAGGLGTIGCGTLGADEVKRIIQQTLQQTDRPFALNIPLTVSGNVKALIRLAVDYKVPVISLSAGNPAPFIPYLHEQGIKVISVVGTVKHAVKAAEAGTDIIVAEGFEAAGINSPLETTTMTLIPQVADAVDVPVAAAGGIGDGRGMLAAFALGAQGVQMGTRFIATAEAPFSEVYKQRVLSAVDTSTIIVGRSVGRTRRVLDGPYAKRLRESEKNGIEPETFHQATSEKFHCIGALEGDEEHGFMNSGQIAGLVRTIPTVQELIDQMMSEYDAQLKSLTPIFRG